MTNAWRLGCGGSGDFFGLGGAPEGLEAEQEPHVGVEVLCEPLLVDRELVEELRVVAEGERLDGGGVDFGVGGFDVGVRLGVAEGEDVFFHGVDAVDAPCVLGEALGELDFDHAVGLEGGGVFADEGVVGFGVLFGHENGVAGEGIAAADEDGFVLFDVDRFRTVEQAHVLSQPHIHTRLGKMDFEIGVFC